MFNLLPTLEGFSHQTAVGINSVLTAHKKNSDVTHLRQKKNVVLRIEQAVK